MRKRMEEKLRKKGEGPKAKEPTETLQQEKDRLLAEASGALSLFSVNQPTCWNNEMVSMESWKAFLYATKGIYLRDAHDACHGTYVARQMLRDGILRDSLALHARLQPSIVLM